MSEFVIDLLCLGAGMFIGVMLMCIVIVGGDGDA